MATVDVDASLAADSSASPGLTAAYSAGASFPAGSLMGPNAGVIWDFALSTAADSASAADAGINYAINASLPADSGQTAAGGLRFQVTSSHSAQSVCSGNMLEHASAVCGILANSGFTCAGFDKVHHNLGSRNPATATPPRAPRINPPPPANPTYSVGSIRRRG